MRNLFTRGKTNLRLAAGGLVLAALSACGGGTSTDNGTGDATSGGPGNSPVTVSGRVADGYINGAIVFWDCNDNLTLDDGEISVRSASGGAFTIPVASPEVCKLRAEIPSTAIDEDTNLPIGRSLTMAAVDGHPEFISPLTTLAALGVATEAELKAKFLGNTTIAITDDYIAAGLAGVPMHNAARYSALALQAVGGNIKTSDADGRKQLLSIAVSILPNEAWVSQTPVLQSALDNFLGTIPKLSTNNILSGSPSSIEFILNESAFNGVNDPRRATVKKALDALKDYPYVVVGSNIRWRALPSSVLASFGPGLADKSLFPATPEETVVRDRIFVALQEAQTANAAGLKNVNRAVGATFFKNAIDMSLTSVNSALTLVPAAGYVKNAVFFNTNIAKLKKASAISKEAANRLGDFVSLIQECGNLANDLTYLSVAPDLMSITDLKDPAVNLTKCVAGMMGSDKVKAIVDAINLGSTTGGAAYDGELIKLLKALSDVTSLSLDLAQLSVPAAMYNETFGMLITSINAVLEINQSADAQDLIFEALLKDISAKFNAVAAREGEVLIATRLKPYITTLGNQFTFTHGLAVINAISTFNITGTNLPATAPLDITFNGCANIEFVSQSAAQHQFTCTPTVADTLTAVIRTLPGTTPLGSFSVAVSAATTLTSQSGTFTVASNLLPGYVFTVPTGAAQCIFSATGQWAAGDGFPMLTAAGDITAPAPTWLISRGIPMYDRPFGALVAKRGSDNKYYFIGAEMSLTVPPGETLSFMMNDATDSGYTGVGGNVGSQSVSWSCSTALGVPVAIMGTFTVLAAEEAGTVFTVPVGLSSCSFNASGTWREVSHANYGPDGLGYAHPATYLPSASLGALIAQRRGIFGFVGSSQNMSVNSNEAEAVRFLFNDVPGSYGPTGGNSGSVVVSYSCKY